MIRPTDLSLRNPKEIRVPRVRFLREQDGPPERLLKKRLIEFFERRPDMQRAYLAQVNAGDQIGVALCLKNLIGPDRALVDQIGEIFAAVFHAREHLDILFLNDEQESELGGACPPFFETAAAPRR